MMTLINLLILFLSGVCVTWWVLSLTQALDSINTDK